jgi:N6-adenosine-specific RNA methylase IME4
MKFDVIYADPSWEFKTYSQKGKGRSPENHYKCMTIEDIYNLPVGDIASENSVLFLWVTWPLLREGIRTMSEWGFDYKTVGFVWIKRNKVAQDTNFWGMGYWSRANSEVCILGTKGNPKRVNKGVHQVVETFDNFETEVITAPVAQHSAKPIEVRERIGLLMGPGVSKIILYSRSEREGWMCLGNEIDGIDLRDSLPKLANS